jgi:hypothetical protein
VDDKQGQSNPTVLVMWIAANAAAGLFMYVFSYGFPVLIEIRFPGDFYANMFYVGISALILSILQWRVLNSELENAGAWIPATFLSFLLGRLITFFIIREQFAMNLISPMADPLRAYAMDSAFHFTAALVEGALIGITQWLVLRRIRSKAGLWIPLTMLGMVTGALVAYSVSYVTHAISAEISLGLTYSLPTLARLVPIFPEAVAGLIEYTIIGVFTGWVLIRLLPRASTVEDAQE